MVAPLFVFTLYLVDDVKCLNLHHYEREEKRTKSREGHEDV